MATPKILGIHSIGWLGDNTNFESGVDLWRIYRPLEELKKHVDWQIDYQPTLIYGLEKYKDRKEFTDEELAKAAEQLSRYDVIFSSYQPDPGAAALLDYVQDKYGTKFVLDVDDDMFAINPHNPFWTRVDDWGVFVMQRVIRTQKYLTTTTEVLKKKFQERSEVDGEIFVIPNFMPDTYQHPPVDNGDDIVIGYFGGSSHYVDLHDSNVLPAIQKLMHEHKNVRFKCVGQPVDYYLPRQRVELHEATRGRKWVTDLFPTLNMDIAIAPLEDCIFNEGKSDIKWQEATRAGAAFVASNLGPYKALKDCATLVNNTEDEWYTALKSLLDKQTRQKQLAQAQKELDKRRLEDNWIMYKEMFEKVIGG